MKTLKINEKFKIESDSENCSLIFTEPRIATKGKDIGKKYIYTDSYHYPTIQSALVKYLQICQEDAQTVQECIDITEKTIKEIRTLKYA